MEIKTGYAVAVPAEKVLLYAIIARKEQELHELLSAQGVRASLIGAGIEKENHRLLSCVRQEKARKQRQTGFARCSTLKSFVNYICVVLLKKEKR